MFCRKCGVPTEDGQTLCPKCAAEAANASNETVVLNEEPIEETIVLNDEPIVLDEEPIVVTQEAPVEDTFVLSSIDAEPEVKPAKKKKKKGLIISIVALVTAAAVGVGCIFCWDYVSAFFARTFQKPEDYFASVEEDAIADYAAELSASYGQMLKGSQTAYSASKMQMQLALGDELISLVETTLAQQGVSVDLDWLKSIDLSMDANMQDTAMQLALGLGLGENELLAADAIIDTENNKFYFAIPTVNKDYIYVDLPEDQFVSLSDQLAQSTVLSQELMENLPSEEEFEDLINTYAKIILSGINNVEKETKTVKVNGISQKMVVLKAKITEKDMIKIAEKILEEAENDKTVEKFLDALSIYANNVNQANSSSYEDYYGDYYTYSEVDLHEEFINNLPTMLGRLETAKDTADSGNYVKLNAYVDMKGNVCGHDLTVYTNGKKDMTAISWLTATKGDTVYTEIVLGEMVVITGETIEKDGVTNGTYTFTVADRELVTLKLENAGETSGTLKLAPGEDLLNAIMAESGFPTALIGGSLELELSYAENSVTISVLVNSKAYMSLNLTSEAYDGSKISIPKFAYSIEQIDYWLTDADFSELVEALEDLDLPDELWESIGQYAGMLQ